MCGLAGTFGGTKDEVEVMLDQLAHRGPDGRGIIEIDGCIHGHVRLALLDLTDASAQPFKHEGCVLSYNGEIWNYRELRDTLGKLRTTGDTEVLAAALDVAGVVDACRKLDGMFAFAWSSHGQHVLVRDRHGKIPLYVASYQKKIYWASERKAFPKYMIPAALAPGHALDLVAGRSWHWSGSENTLQVNVATIAACLEEGVSQRLHADAPVCCLISGGMDSALVLAIAVKQRGAHNVTAYTAFVDITGNDDLVAAVKLCAEFGIKHRRVRIKGGDELFLRALASIEIPSKAQIEIGALCLPLAKRIRADGFKACLSGESADELFGGYGNFCIQASKVDDAGIVKLRKAQLAKMSRGNFVRCNKAFMAGGVECRLPFMHPRLVAAAVNATKAENPPGKKLLKQVASAYLPKWVISRQKETFQGVSGSSALAAKLICDPQRWYNAELRKLFGYLPHD